MLQGSLRTILFSFLLLVGFAFGGLHTAAASDSIFRCGGESVSVGDSRYTVQKICGKPSRSESVAKSGKSKKKQRELEETASKSSSGKVQKWYYDRGYGDFVYVLTFEKDTLKKIEKSGRGR